MIFDFGAELEIDEEQLNVVSEPQHSEAVKALFAGNPQSFLEILTKNNLDQFTLAPHTVVSDQLNLQDNKAKAEFEKIFTQKFS